MGEACVGGSEKGGVMGGGRGGGGRSHDSRKNRAKRDSNEPSNQRALKSNFGGGVVKRTNAIATHEDIHANTALSLPVDGRCNIYWKTLVVVCCEK